MTQRQPRWRRVIAAGTLPLLVAGVAACGGGDTNTTTAAGGAATAGSDAAPGVAAAQQELDALYKGTFRSPPTSGPKPVAGKKVWLLSCGQAVATCASVIDGAAAAAKSIGWKPTVFDTKSDPNLAANGVRQAIAAKADGIFVMAVDCTLFKEPLAEAKRAGVVVMAAESYDCSQSDRSQPTLFSGQVTYTEGEYPQYIFDYGAAQATWIIAKTEGKGEVINFADDEIQAVKRFNEGFVDKMKSCPDCKVDAVPFKLADIGTSLQQKAEQALLKYPNADALQVPTDAAITGGVAAALQASGRAQQLLVIGAEGQPANMAMVRAGRGQNAGVGQPLAWEGYAGIDGLNRLFSGSKPKNSGIGLQVYDTDHNAGTSGGYRAPIDYQAVYEKSWGIAR